MGFQRLPAEARLLLEGTRRGSFDAEEVRQIAAEGVDWALVRGLALQERLLNVLWRGLLESEVEVPEPHGSAFRGQSSIIEFQLSFAEIVLRQVVEAAHTLGAELLLLKGAALALSVYGSFQDRPMGDLDVLVRPDGAERLWHALRDAGWELEYQGGAEFYADHHHLPPLVRGAGIGVVLEIHRSLLPPRGPFLSSADLAWTSAPVLDLDQGPVRILDAELQLLHLAVHFAWSHTLGRGTVRTVRDVSSLIKERPPDWQRLVELAAGMRAATAVYWTLRITKALGGVSAPCEVLQALGPPRPSWLLAALERNYIEAGMFRSCPSPSLERALWLMGLAPVRSGHGRIRPWTSDRQFETEVAPTGGHEVAVSAPRRSRLARVPAVVAYAGRVVSGRLGGRPIDSSP